MRVLLLDDDTDFSRSIAEGLGAEGHVLVHERDGVIGLTRLRVDAFDACITEVQLPRLDGFAVVSKARKSGITIPILFLTTQAAVSSRVEGFERGGDDYLVKPVAIAELAARLVAFSRRSAPSTRRLQVGDVMLDLKAHQAWIGQRALELSRTQFTIMEYLMRRVGEVIPRATLLDEVLGHERATGTNIVDVHISNLRQKLGSASRLRIITVRGIGYRLEQSSGEE